MLNIKDILSSSARKTFCVLIYLCLVVAASAKDKEQLTSSTKDKEQLTSAAKDNHQLTIAFGGDALFTRHVVIPSPIPLLRESDEEALFVNLECPITHYRTPVSKQIIFRADTTMAEVMQQMGITHAALANNHSIDQGQRGLHETVRHMKRVGITPFGYGTTPEQRMSPAIVRKGKICIAVFNDITFPIENWHSYTSPDEMNITNLSADSLSRIIREYHQQHPDHHIVAFLHWGTEFRSTPTFRQQIDAHRLTQAGASVIVGQHPHVIQEKEFINGRPVYYSLGNYIFDQKQPACREGLKLRLTFNTKGLVRHEARICNTLYN